MWMGNFTDETKFSSICTENKPKARTGPLPAERAFHSVCRGWISPWGLRSTFLLLCVKKKLIAEQHGKTEWEKMVQITYHLGLKHLRKSNSTTRRYRNPHWWCPPRWEVMQVPSMAHKAQTPHFSQQKLKTAV